MVKKKINAFAGPDEEIYPDFGIYHFHLEDAMSAVMKYLPRNDSLIGFTLAVTEEDDTVTIVDTLVSHQGAHTEVEIIGVTSAVGLLSNNEEEGGPTFLHVWEKSVVEVSEEELLDLHLAPGERIVYHDYTLYRLDEVEGEDALGETLVEDLHSLYFCDEFRPYLFQGNKSLPLHGPGTLFYRSDSGDAGIYFLTTPASPFLDIVHTLEERLGHSPPADGMNGGIPAPQQAYPLPHSSGDGVSLEPALPLVVATERPQGVKEEVLLPQEEEEEKVFYPDAATTQWVPQKQTGTTILQTVTTNTVTNDVITTDIITTDVTTDVITTDAVVTGYE